MRIRIIKTVFLKELREMLRDRRSLAIMFGIPLLLYPLLTITIAGLGQSKQKQFTEQHAKIAFINSIDAPHLLKLITKPDSGIDIIDSANPVADLAARRLDAVVTVPRAAEENALALRDTEIKIQIDRSRTESGFIERKLNNVLDQYERWIIEQRLLAQNVKPEVLRPLKHSTDDIASGSQRFGKMLAMMLPVLLLITGMLGALFPALNATTTERELGTMETLLVSPAGRMELLIAKGAIVLLSGLLTSALNMLSMSLVLWRSLSMIEKGMGTLTISPGALVLTFVAAIPTLITFSTLVLMVGLIARNFREANSLATPVMMIPMAAMVVGIAEPKITPGLLVTPVANTTLIIREVLTGTISPGPFVLAFASSCLYAGLMLSLAVRLFSSEQLVNPAWEPVSLKGLRRGGTVRRPRLPAVDEAFALFAITLLLTFYVAPSLQQFGLIPMLLVTEILLIAAPALIAAKIGRYKWVEVFSLRRPTIKFLVGGALLGFGLVPWVQLLVSIQNYFWPENPELRRATSEFLIPALQKHPIILPIILAALAGICEELLYRGPIQSGLLRRLPKWMALIVGGILFAVAHLDAHNIPVRALLGIILGWLVIRTSSIFPAMVAHVVYDSCVLGMASYAIAHGQIEEVRGSATAPVIEWNVSQLAFSAAALLAATILLKPRPKAPDVETAVVPTA